MGYYRLLIISTLFTSYAAFAQPAMDYWKELKDIEEHRLDNLEVTREKLSQIEQFKEKFNKDEQSLFMLLKGHSLIMDSKISAGQGILEKLVDNTEHTGIKARAYSILGSLHRVKGENIQAFIAVDNALDLLTTIKDDSYKLDILVNTVSTYKDAELIEFALEHGRRLLSVANKRKTEEALCNALFELGEIELMANELTLAKQRLLLAKSHCEKGSQKLYTFMVNDALINIDIESEEYDKALTKIEKMFEQVQDYSWELMIATYQIRFAQVYLGKGKVDEALSYAEKAYKMFETVHDVKRKELAASILAKIYTELDRKEEALKYYKEYMEINIENKQRVRQRKLAFDIARRGKMN